MKLLFIGDIVGQPGRAAVAKIVPELRRRHDLDFVVANGENAAGGNGINPRLARELFEAGIDAITTGDHLWDQKEVVDLMENETRFLRPLNYPPGVPGQGSALFTTQSGLTIGVMNVQGRTFMPPLENPFTLGQREVKKLREKTSIIFVDFHGEATSEKIAFARMLDGQVSAVVGTHTHVQTADEQIFPGGTAFLCDAGCTGPQHGCLGRELEPVIKRFLTGMPQRFEVASKDIELQGCIIEIGELSGQASSITRVREKFTPPAV